MATSGRVQTNSYKTSSFYVNWQRVDYSIPSNYSDINWQAGLNITGYDEWYSNAVKINNVKINGTTVYSGGTFSNITTSGDHQLASGTIRIYHNDNGEKTFNISISGWLYNYGNASGSDDFTLDKIPRYATSNVSLESKSETSITIRWSSDSTIDYVWYSANYGTTWNAIGSVNAKSGTRTIAGLSANTKYGIKVRVRRKDSQLTTDSSTLEITTYDYPHCTDTPNFVIGEELKLTLYNPLSRLVTIAFIGANGETLSTDETAMTSVTGYNTESFKTKLYNTIPNATSGKYQIKVTYSNSTKTRNNGNTYSINPNDCIPIFNDFTYKDINADIVNVTSNDQVLVKGFSNLQVTVSSANKMVPVNSANPNKYIATIDTLNKSKDYEDNDVSFEVGTPLNGGTKRLTVTAYDSRNVSKAVYKDILVYDYIKPVINVDVARLNNFEAQTTLKINGSYDVMNIDGSNKNAITQVQYRYREIGGEWIDWVTVNTTVTNDKYTCNDVIISLDNTKAFEIEAKVNDRISDAVASGTVDVGEAIFFISSNKKQCYINGKQVMTGLAQDVNRTDLNDYMNEFLAGYGHNLSNVPSNDLNLGHLISIPRHDAEGFTAQLFIPYTTDDLYIRKCNEGTWGEWRIINKQDVTTNGKAVKCGYKVDGKDVYKKRVNVGKLPNATTKNYAHGLTNFTIVEKPSGFATSTDGNTIPLPELHLDGLSYSVSLEVDGTNIKIRAGSNRSGYTGYVDIYFTYN